MIAAIEATVCDGSLSLYMRGFTFYKLLKLWAAARHSDFESLNPASLILTQQGLEGRLDRTKTSGPGRRVRFLPIFVSRAAYLVCPQWLEVGLQIWSSAGMNFERDFFLTITMCRLGGMQASHGILQSSGCNYQSFVAVTALAEVSWQFSDQCLFTSPDALSLWTEHSERIWLNSVLAALEVPREQRDFLGRWRASSSCDEYMRSARIIVMKLQAKAVDGLRCDKTGELRFLGVTELTTHLRTACKFCEEKSWQSLNLICLTPREWYCPTRLPQTRAERPPAQLRKLRFHHGSLLLPSLLDQIVKKHRFSSPWWASAVCGDYMKIRAARHPLVSCVKSSLCGPSRARNYFLILFCNSWEANNRMNNRLNPLSPHLLITSPRSVREERPEGETNGTRSAMEGVRCGAVP